MKEALSPVANDERTGVGDPDGLHNVLEKLRLMQQDAESVRRAFDGSMDLPDLSLPRKTE